MSNSRRYITIADAAAILAVSSITARRMHLRGELPTVKVGPRLVRVDAEKLEAMLSGTSQGVK